MRHCVYITLNTKEDFYCDNYQKCCESNCCNDPFRWYYWASLILSFILLAIAIVACCRWKHRRSNTNVTNLSHIFPRLHQEQTGPHQIVPSVLVSQYPAYAWSAPTGLPCPLLPNQLHSPYMHRRPEHLQLNQPPPSYEEIFGPNNPNGTNPSVQDSDSQQIRNNTRLEPSNLHN